MNGRRVFKAVCQTEALSEQVLLQIQELTVNPSSSTSSCDNSSLVNGSMLIFVILHWFEKNFKSFWTYKLLNIWQENDAYNFNSE